jgi:hypothetical protein
MQETFAGNGAKCVFSSAFLRAGVVQIQASPKLWTSVLALVMCIFRGGLIGRMLARPAWPWSLFPMPAATCAAGKWFSQRGVAQRVDLITSVCLFPMPAATCAAGSWFSQRGVAQRVDLITSVLGRAAWSSFCIASRCGLLPDCSAQGSPQFAAVLEACSFCVEPQRGLLPPGLFSSRSLPLAVVAVSRVMGIMACTVRRQLA